MADTILHISPTLLDKFQAWQESECLWNEYYGQSESPAYSLQDWDAKLEQELIDACNGVETESSRAADLGTCLNEAVDCILLRTSSTRGDVFLSSGHDGKNDLGECVFAVKGENRFMFHAQDVRNLATHFAGCVPQDYVTADIDTQYGKVQLYGYPDYYNPSTGEVIDLKTTRRYEWGKFRYKWQRLVYPYILRKSGRLATYKDFTFAVCKVSGDNDYNHWTELEMVRETYTDPVEGMGAVIRWAVERFCEWYEIQRKNGTCNDRLLGRRDE